MNIKKTVAAAAIATLLGGGLALATALPSSAHTYGAEATCEDGLTVGLYNYHPTIPGEDAVPGTPEIPGAHHDAVGTPTIIVDNPDYVPGKDAVPAVTHTEYEFRQYITGKTRWETNPNWNAQGNIHSIGWVATGNTKVVTDVEGQAAVPAQGEPTIEIDNPDYVPAYDDPATPATPGKDAVPEQANHVNITQDGEPFVDSDFSDHFAENYPNPDKTVEHTWVVTVTSNDGIGEFTKTLHVDACEMPAPGAANPAATIDASCGLADITMTNDGENLLTASFVVYVDGNFHGAYAVEAGDHQKVSLTFPEDSGDHVVEVRTGPAFGDEILATATVKSDCKPAVVIPPTETPSAPPVAPQAPAAPVAPAAAPVAATPIQLSAEDTLAQTGSDSLGTGLGFGAAAVLLALLGTAIIVGARRKAHQE